MQGSHGLLALQNAWQSFQADALHQQELDKQQVAVAYAQALLKLHEVNLATAVIKDVLATCRKMQTR